jgi:hypothetical protein
MAENGSSQTVYTAPRSFTVAATSIKQQAVQLNAPANNYLTNQSTVTFSWSAIYGATQYLFEIDTNNFVNPASVVSNSVIPGQQINFTFPKAKTYQWRVQAQNDTAQAQWSVVNNITFNNIPPAQVIVTAPANGQTLQKPVSLQWKAVVNAVKYKLYVFKSDSTTLYSSNFPVVLTGTNYSFNLGASGDKIYWAVTAVDAEGNEGTPSVLRNFVLQ